MHSAIEGYPGMMSLHASHTFSSSRTAANLSIMKSWILSVRKHNFASRSWEGGASLYVPRTPFSASVD